MRSGVVLLVGLLGCGSGARDPRPGSAPGSGPPPDPAVAAVVPAPRPPPGFAALGPAAPVVRDPDGLPLLEVTTRAAAGSAPPGLRWLGASDDVLQFTHSEASDGARVYAALDDDGHDLIVRDGVLTEDSLAARGAGRGGCVAARAGALWLSAPAVTDRDQAVRTRNPDGTVTDSVRKAEAQMVWTIGVDGAVAQQELPGSTEDRCWLRAGDGGRYTLGGFGLVTWDGHAFTEERGVMGARLTVGRVGGPAYCFASCNQAEAAANPPMTAQLATALGCPGTWIAHDDRVAGACDGRAVRWREGGAIERVAIPATTMIGGAPLAFTDRGDLVIGLDYGFKRYAVWPAGQRALGPVRTLPAGEVIAHASPTVHVRGLGGAAPEATVAAVVLGAPIGYGANGSTYGYAAITRTDPPFAAQLDRARAVLGGTGPLWVAHEAVIDPACGGFVRSPVGWEQEAIDDWEPPVLPALSPLAVTRPASCTPLDAVIAVPGVPDLLLALRGDRLLAAWLPPPLPLPGGRDPRTGHAEPAPPQHPRPGLPWFEVGRASALVGLPGGPAPARSTAVPEHSWAAGGAATVTAGPSTILVMPGGAVAIPAGTRPMAVGLYGGPRAWGALGPALVDCAATCRVIDPGVGVDLVAVVPRGDRELVLGFADGRVAAFTVPATGGTEVPRDPLADALAAALARRP